MKTIIITFLLICYAVCNGQVDNSIKLQGWDYDSAYSTMQIEDDTGTVFYYSSQDSTSLFIGDSLRTIKWLIQIVVEDMKKHYPPPNFIEPDTIPKVYRHKSSVTLTSIPVQYQCDRCGKIYQDIGDTTECILPKNKK